MAFHAQTVMNRVGITESCWLWLGQINHGGYGVFTWSEDGKPIGRGAHRVIYAMFEGEPEEGLTLDHLCRVRHCVNPDHLEPVTIKENINRRPDNVSEACRRGHPYREQTGFYANANSRRCHVCHAERQREYRLTRKRG